MCVYADERVVRLRLEEKLILQSHIDFITGTYVLTHAQCFLLVLTVCRSVWHPRGAGAADDHGLCGAAEKRLEAVAQDQDCLEQCIVRARHGV